MDDASSTHWESVYRQKTSDQVSWYAPHLALSLELIRATRSDRSTAIIDVGGGESTLVDDLLEAGYRDISVLDLSETALEVTRQRLGSRTACVHWIQGDITQVSLPEHRYDLWHDRAVFHFLTSPADRVAYVARVSASVRPGGHVIVATFGIEGPARCSGLEVVRYDAAGLHHEFGARFRLLDHRSEAHQTPFGTTQQFLYCLCRVDDASTDEPATGQ